MSETLPTNSNPESENPNTGEIPRETAQERGEKTYDASRTTGETESPQTVEEALRGMSREQLLALRDRLQAQESGAAQTTESETSTGETQAKARERMERTKQTSGAKKFIMGAIAAALALAIAIPGVTSIFDKGNTDTLPNDTPITQPAGEFLSTSYDYSEWSDFEHKLGQYNFGYDKTDLHGDEVGMKQELIQTAEENPEALAAYAYEYLTDAEKDALGIGGMTATQIEDAMGDLDDPMSIALHDSILNKFREVINDEGTSLGFKTVNGTEYSYYEFGVDDNNDGKWTPDEVHLGYSQVERHDSKQFDVERTIDGHKGKIGASINEDCGLQPTKSTPPEGVPPVPGNPGDPGNPNNPGDPGDPGDPGNPDNPPVPDDPPGHQPKNEEAERKNAGPRVDQQSLNENVTPPTTLQQDQAPVQSAHEQVSSGNMAGSEAEKAQQAAVDNSAQTKQNNQESTSHADDTASERAKAFENGDF